MEIERGLVKTSVGYIHYRAAGRGRAILLFHPSQQSSALFLELLEVLGKKLRAVAMDYPSFGMSDHISWQPKVSDYAKWAVEVMDGLGIQKASFMGEAVGAAVAMEAANSFPDRTEKVVIVNCPFYPDKESVKKSHTPLKTGLRPEDATGFPITRNIEFVLERDPEHSPLHPNQSWMDRMNVAQIEAGRERWQALNALDAYDITSNLERLKSPVLLLYGEHFKYAKLRDEFTRRIKNHQWQTIPGGRFCLPWEKPNEVSEAVFKFLG